MSDYLSREDAPISANSWELLDNTMINVARARLTARKILDIEGPYGLALKVIPVRDRVVSEGPTRLVSTDVLPVPMLETGFTLGVRDMAAYEENGFAPDTEPLARAVTDLADMEDALIFEGNKKLGITGLMNSSGTNTISLGNWEDIGAPADSVIRAVTALDEAGFYGPYALALAPGLYNMLYRRYPDGNQTILEHISAIVGSKAIKAPGIKTGGVLMATGKQFASIVMGQDMTIGFVGPESNKLEFTITESIVPNIRVPQAVCVLKP